MSNKASRRLQADWPPYMSYDKSNNEVEQFYSTINGKIRERSSIFFDKRQIDIFLLAMAVGKSMETRKPMKNASKSIRRDALIEEEVWMMCSVALAEENRLDVLADGDKVVRICEEYANAGIEVLISLDRQTGETEPYEEFLEKFLDNK